MNDKPTKLAAEVLDSIPNVITGIINGDPLDAGDNKCLAVINPDTGKEILQIAENSPEDVHIAVQSAYETFQKGVWSQASPKQRQDVLFITTTLIRDNAEELAVLDSLTTGLLYKSSTLGQVAAAADWFEYFAGILDTSSDLINDQTQETKAIVTREPVGVAGLFTPWNIPLMGAALKMSAALAMGNSIVIKPSEQSPLATAKLIHLLHEARLPRGVVHLVNGRGAVTGAALAADNLVDLISFTGGGDAGRIINGEAAKRFAKVTMELGGKSANIICDDADYNRALDGAMVAIYANNGQACLAGSRILVHKKIADKFIADFTARTQNIKIGRPFDPSAELGPQSSQAQMERVLSFKDLVEQEDGEILADGNKASGFGKGFYVEPTVALAKSNAAKVCQQEIFGPFATFLIFENDKEAIQIANDTKFGLAGYVWSTNLERANTISSQLRSGTILINTPMVRNRNTPFGGLGNRALTGKVGAGASISTVKPKRLSLQTAADPFQLWASRRS